MYLQHGGVTVRIADVTAPQVCSVSFTFYLLFGGVVELILARTPEALLHAVVFPEPLHEVRHVRAKLAIVSTRQTKQLTTVVLHTINV